MLDGSLLDDENLDRWVEANVELLSGGLYRGGRRADREVEFDPAGRAAPAGFTCRRARGPTPSS